MGRPRMQADTRNMNVGQSPDIILNDGTLATGGLIVEPVAGSMNKSYLDELAFNEEEMVVMVNETSDENAENPVIVGNGGVFAQFFRGQATVAKRKFVDCLIVKSGRVTTPETLNGAGERTNVIRQQSAHKYPFMVVEDKNPKGREWLTRRFADVM